MSSETLKLFHGAPIEMLSSPPFVIIPGVINIRALGGTVRVSDTDNISNHDNTCIHIKPLHIFRSGELTKITEDGKAKLHELGVRTVFDLRSDNEVARYNSATPDLDGIEIVRVPALKEEGWEIDISERLQQFKEDEIKAHLNIYGNILETAGLAYGRIFTYLRDYPINPCLVHCTVGKDRTGMFVALFYMLMGLRDEEIAHDYGLSIVGLAPVSAALEARFKAVPVYRDNWEAVVKMGDAKPETMMAILSMIRERFGGIEGYLKSYGRLTDEDLVKIRENMLVGER